MSCLDRSWIVSSDRDNKNLNLLPEVVKIPFIIILQLLKHLPTSVSDGINRSLVYHFLGCAWVHQRQRGNFSPWLCSWWYLWHDVTTTSATAVVRIFISPTSTIHVSNNWYIIHQLIDVSETPFDLKVEKFSKKMVPLDCVRWPGRTPANAWCICISMHGSGYSNNKRFLKRPPDVT